jgi:hypothetical protein
LFAKTDTGGDVRNGPESYGDPVVTRR